MSVLPLLVILNIFTHAHIFLLLSTAIHQCRSEPATLRETLSLSETQPAQHARLRRVHRSPPNSYAYNHANSCPDITTERAANNVANGPTNIATKHSTNSATNSPTNIVADSPTDNAADASSHGFPDSVADQNAVGPPDAFTVRTTHSAPNTSADHTTNRGTNGE